VTSRVSLEPSLDPADYSFRTDVRVRFAETDAMGVVHHASYLPYLESARVEYLRSIGRDYASLRAGGVEFPVLEVAVRYLQPCYFDDLVTVHLRMAPSSRATFQVAYLLTVGGKPRAVAVTVHSSIDRNQRPTRLPGWLLET
jgi:acyl-CoA thioester hydrolase